MANFRIPEEADTELQTIVKRLQRFDLDAQLGQLRNMHETLADEIKAVERAIELNDQIDE